MKGERKMKIKKICIIALIIVLISSLATSCFAVTEATEATNNSKITKEQLNEKFQELGIGKYEKNMNNIFEILMKSGNPKLAIRYAKRIIENGVGKTPAQIAPGTKVYELAEELAKYLPEEIQKYFY